MLQELGLKDLKDRHRLALLFKVVQGHVGVSPEDIGLEPEQTIYINSEPEEQELTHIYIYICSFASRTISDWNKLPAAIVEGDSPQAFKAGRH